MDHKPVFVQTRESITTRGNLASVFALQAERGEGVCFWWLGQAGFAIRHQESLLLIDPYLSNSLAEKYKNAEFKHQRMIPIPVDPADIRGCQYYLCTHAHTDHMDPLTIQSLQHGSHPFFIVPRAEIDRAVERGMAASSLGNINAGEIIELDGDIKIEALASAHEKLEIDANGNFKHLGYVISIGGLRLYHSGDCVPYPGLAQHLAQLCIDIALLPINGRDEYRASRGVPGNFTLSEAIELCQMAAIPMLVGHHFEMFDFNTIDREEAVEILNQKAGNLKWLLPEIGLTYQIRQD
jgi:L-ascorbate metabolism protein UlaG (beta-lactamase superfamily)